MNINHLLTISYETHSRVDGRTDEWTGGSDGWMDGMTDRRMLSERQKMERLVDEWKEWADVERSESWVDGW